MTPPTATKDQRQLLEQALRQLRGVRAQLAASERAKHEPIAVIGAAVRAPGGVSDPDSLWQLLATGTDAVGPEAGGPEGHRPGEPRPGRYAGLLSEVDGFDAGFFGISADEADHLDPQQRLVLEAAWEAAEDAGLPVERLRERDTGVFLGVYNHDYLGLQLSGQADITTYTAPGGANSMAANRLSYLLDLHGPSVAVDTACSSSLVALHLACRALRQGDCDYALVGGVNVILSEATTQATGKVLPIAPGGRCRTFDAEADGIVRAEGCGVLLLERASDADRHGRHVRALIRGTAVNHNGRTNGLTAPSPPAQTRLLRRALADAAADPADVLYVEAHGTGTRLGDPIEAEALREVYGAGEEPCAVGSVKTNFGHQEAAAGIIGLLKAMLVLQMGQVPPNVHFTRLNPEIDLQGTRLTVPTKLTDLPAASRRLAAVSAMGFGGANAHVVLEAAPPTPRAEAGPGRADAREGGTPLLLPLSARSTGALAALAAGYADRLAHLGPAEAAEFCAAAARGRTHHAYRLCPGAADAAGLVAQLRAARTEFTRPSPAARRVAFVFSGQGTQWEGMGRELLATQPVVRAEVEKCDEVIRERVGWSVLDQLTAPPGESRLHETEVAQLSMAALQWGLAELWRSWGVEPYAVAGHSMGEIVAARAAGILGREEAVDLLIARARLTEEGARGGAMASLTLPLAEVEPLLAEAGGRIGIGAVNGPRSTVVSGDPEAVARVEAAAAALGAKTKRLSVGYAFHSPLLDGADAALAAEVASLTPRRGTTQLYSTVTGDRVEPADLTPAHWGRNLRGTVRFRDAVAALARDGVGVFVEVGPHPALLRDLGATLEERAEEGGTAGAGHLATGSLRRDRPATEALHESLADLYCAGLRLDWDAIWPAPRRQVALPTYPWQRRRHWLRMRPAAELATAQGSFTAAPAESGTAAEAAGAALSGAEIEAAVTDFIRDQLAVALEREEPVPVDGRLDALGLTSLLIVELKNRIEREFGTQVPLRPFLEGGSPASLARLVAQALHDGAPAAGGQ
ncbi:type I polyketide synthase [Streptomyces hoynatensis]|uniref:Acyltransferase domain-containing protein n=1 Tax=Streptomyces hoynatensis TaxID=1141874 RepID=A0A3A9YTZ1_9ACTN|nr:type I polyketide synthase [Streptomyces hoynatensis]RKN39508.1 acyltransferase domain-containing protein [Streptomyces hoynatensis]